jgi:dTDP-4-dehydrorhamnose reductase
VQPDRDRRFAELDALIRSGRGDQRPGSSAELAAARRQNGHVDLVSIVWHAAAEQNISRYEFRRAIYLAAKGDMGRLDTHISECEKKATRIGDARLAAWARRLRGVRETAADAVEQAIGEERVP